MERSEAPAQIDVMLAEVASAGRAGIFAIPTTNAYVCQATTLCKAGLALVVADRTRFPKLDGSLTPVELLDAHKTRSHRPAKSILSFTDQFVDATNAPLAVNLGSTCEFRSSIEVVASARFQMPLQFLCGNHLSQQLVIRQNDCVSLAMLHMSDYLDACERLGPAWLARTIQTERLLESRCRISVLLKKQYASLVMASAVEFGPTQTHARMLDQLTLRAR